jgi:hypothetical protein
MANAIDLDDLKRKASAATPGPWRRAIKARVSRTELLHELATKWLHPEGQGDPDFFMVHAGEVCPCITANGPTSRANAAHIAAADPQTVLALVRVVEVALDYELNMGGDRLVTLNRALAPFRKEAP